jgi:hypothetical protein
MFDDDEVEPAIVDANCGANDAPIDVDDDVDTVDGNRGGNAIGFFESTFIVAVALAPFFDFDLESVEEAPPISISVPAAPAPGTWGCGVNENGVVAAPVVAAVVLPTALFRRDIDLVAGALLSCFARNAPTQKQNTEHVRTTTEDILRLRHTIDNAIDLS